jgi:hypothetical protein
MTTLIAALEDLKRVGVVIFLVRLVSFGFGCHPIIPIEIVEWEKGIALYACDDAR